MQILKLGLVLTVAIFVGFIQGCEKGSRNYSTPKAAAKSMADAMMRGDGAGVKAAIINGDPQMIDVFVSAMSSSKAVSDAAASKFGAEAKNGFEQGPGMGDISKKLDDADEKIDGDDATVTMKDGSPGMKLKKVSGDWKVDFAQMPGMSKMSAEDLKPLQAMADVNKQLAADIAAGKYATVADAEKARSQKILEVMTSNVPTGVKAP